MPILCTFEIFEISKKNHSLEFNAQGWRSITGNHIFIVWKYIDCTQLYTWCFEMENAPLPLFTGEAFEAQDRNDWETLLTRSLSNFKTLGSLAFSLFITFFTKLSISFHNKNHKKNKFTKHCLYLRVWDSMKKRDITSLRLAQY